MKEDGRGIYPEHYKNGSLDCFEVMKVAFGNDETYAFCKLNAFKYLWRHKSKGGLEDLQKAETYIGMAERLNPNTDRQMRWLKWEISDSMEEWKDGHV